MNNPFPAAVKPGSCLGVLIQYTPTCDGARCCELVIESDDPVMPRKTLTVTGHMHRTLKSALKCWAASELRELLDAVVGAVDGERAMASPAFSCAAPFGARIS